jgi:hypothetical protein
MHSPKPSPATIIACMALFVALGGTAIAASHYVITSTSQIKPSVRSALAAPGPDVEINTSEVSVKPGELLGLARAECPKADHVVTGGYVVELAPGAYVVKDEPTGIFGWSVGIDNQHASEVSKVRAEALCAPGREGGFVFG